jgi:hypothetical protein
METSQAHALKSSGANTVNLRLEECLIYVRYKKRIYDTVHDLALDYGKHGTRKFFPLPMLEGLISQDDRFTPYYLVDGVRLS